MKDRFKTIRKNANITQTECAKRLNVSRSLLAKFEIGECLISDRTIKDICKLFSVNEEWLRYGTGEMYSRDKDEVAEIVSKFMDNEDDEFNQLLLQAMRLYQNLDSKNQEIIRDFINKLRK